jgi:hypothetical protein
VDYYNFHSYEGPGGGGITYEFSYVFHGPVPVLGGPPFAAGYWYWDIPWYFGTRTKARVVHFVTKREMATSDAAGTAVISKAGASESKAANDPTTTY